MKVELESEYPINGGSGTVRYYRVGEWSFEVMNPSTGNDDSNLDYANQAIEAWTAWRDFIVSGGLVDSNSNNEERGNDDRS